MGCVIFSAAADTGSSVCLEFLEYIRTGKYEQAYALISEDVKYLSGEKTPPDELRISQAEFIARYKDILEDALQLEAIAYEVINVADGRVLSSIDYRLQYFSPLTENLDFKFTMTAEWQAGSWRILWTPALLFPDMDWGDTILSGVLRPKRGEIFCADGDVYAKNIPGVAIFCVPSKIDLGDYKPLTDVKKLFEVADDNLTPEQIEEKAHYLPFQEQVSAIAELKTEPKKIRSAFARTHQDITNLAVIYPDQLTPELQARILAIPGLGIDEGGAFATLREYPHGEFLGHLMGYAGVIQSEYLRGVDQYEQPTPELYLGDELTKGDNPVYDGDSWLGYEGLEKHYEATLRGTKGSFAYVQKKEGANQVLFLKPAIDGEDLHLTIQPKLQRRLEEVYNTIVYDETILGTVVVLNPKTGAVEAMYSKPGYDPNIFSRGFDGSTEWEAIKADIRAPLINRCIQGQYPPGSTFKVLTAAMTLESGTMGVDSTFPDTERLKWDIWYPSTRNGEFSHAGAAEVRRTGNTNRHTPMNMESSLIDSDNIFFSYCAMKMGWDNFVWYLEKMGFYGTPTGKILAGGKAETTGIPFDLPVAGPQIVNTGNDTYKENATLLAMTGYGQGELLITPLQMASYVGGFANGGNVMTPYLVGSTWRNADLETYNLRGRDYKQVSSHEPTVWKSIASQANADAIAKMMVGVCRSAQLRGYERGGTGRYLGVTSYDIAGKTGTAEIGTKAEGSKDAPKELAWFIGFRHLKTARDSEPMPVPDSEQRLVLVMLEIDKQKEPLEAAMMKFLVARALLAYDELTIEDAGEEYLSIIS